MGAVLAKLSCALWGHHVDNHVFKRAAGRDRRCRCGTGYLGEDGSITRVRHTLSCFLGQHQYEKLADRDGCHEYVCVQCGHPLLFDAEDDPYSASATFRKKVRYLCGLFGHRVRHVTTRDGFEEYACFCGHSFLKAVGGYEDRPRHKIRHPAICVVSGHFIHFLTTRNGFAEYVCRNCGHPFCFAYNPAHEAGYLGHVHRAEVHQPVPAVVGAAHRVG
ncbi:MAG TPA: hypothetical protein VFP85_10940 [Vicinamibacterales bacterium]|nr:hypothetical protein [Vicinamibacterales bacterium]